MEIHSTAQSRKRALFFQYRQPKVSDALPMTEDEMSENRKITFNIIEKGRGTEIKVVYG